MKESDIRKKEAYDKYLELVRIDVDRYFNDKTSFLKVDCPACFSSNYNFEFKKNGFSYCLCKDCNTLFVTPRPSDKQLRDFYVNSPSSEFWVNGFFKPVAEARRDNIFKPRAEKIAGIIRPESKDNFKIADIGAGFGLFLEELRKIMPGLDMTAVEPSPQMAEICRYKNLTVIEDAFENLTPAAEFDLMVCFEFFEHLFSPKDFFAKAVKLLKPGGLFYFTTLNSEGFDIQILWKNSKSIFPPQHINFFNPNSVALLAKNTGFEILSIETPGKLDWDIVDSMYRDKSVETDRFWRLVSQRTDVQVKEKLQSWISESGLSSHMAVLLKKNQVC